MRKREEIRWKQSVLGELCLQPQGCGKVRPLYFSMFFSIYLNLPLRPSHAFFLYIKIFLFFEYLEFN